MNHPEDTECEAFWQWAQLVPPLRDHLYHPPNGGRRGIREAARMKKQGVRAGVSDYHLPLARGGYIGLWIEMKAPKPHKSTLSAAQEDWLIKMRVAGHSVHVCYGWQAARKVCEEYLNS